jgi:hypothetical protein
MEIDFKKIKLKRKKTKKQKQIKEGRGEALHTKTMKHCIKRKEELKRCIINNFWFLNVILSLFIVYLCI